MSNTAKIALSVLAIAGIATVTYSVYKHYKLKKIYETPITEQQAIANIQKALAK
jgi:hypothetical protein